MIIDQQWALNAIYAVLERDNDVYPTLKRLKGRFTRHDLNVLLWGRPRKDADGTELPPYTDGQQEVFLQMMLSCGICFVLRKGEKADDEGPAEPTLYLAPDLLPDRNEISGVLAQSWQESTPVTLSAVFHYDFVPPGLSSKILPPMPKPATP